MVELVALAVADATRRLWKYVFLGRLSAMALWLAYGITLPEAVVWAEHVFPEEVNLALPFAGVGGATITAVRHYRHKHHHDHTKHSVETVSH